jgi:hypothetical protein
MPIFESLEASGLGVWVRESYFGYPIVLTAHSVGMGVVVGIMMILGVRVLGYARGIPLAAFDLLFTVAWVGFIVNAVSGVLLFLGNATKLAENVPFLLKLVLIVAGGISVWVLWRTIGPSSDGLTADGVGTSRAKSIAVATMVFWLGAVLAGRLIGYTVSYY